MPHSASVVVSRALPDIEAHMWTVTNWLSCLSDVVSARRHSHERYTVELAAGRRVDEVLVAVRWNARHHRFSWKGLDGPTWNGELRLTAVNGRRTRVELDVVSVPRTFLGGLAEMLGAGRREAGSDLQRLHDMLDELSAPVRPSRLEVGAVIPELDIAAMAAESLPPFEDAQPQGHLVPVPVTR